MYFPNCKSKVSNYFIIGEDKSVLPISKGLCTIRKNTVNSNCDLIAWLQKYLHFYIAFSVIAIDLLLYLWWLRRTATSLTLCEHPRLPVRMKSTVWGVRGAPPVPTWPVASWWLPRTCAIMTLRDDLKCLKIVVSRLMFTKNDARFDDEPFGDFKWNILANSVLVRCA